jgi:hypothetical protein
MRIQQRIAVVQAAAKEEVHQQQEQESRSGLDCEVCGTKAGYVDSNCCFPGGSWAGMCDFGDFTWLEGYNACNVVPVTNDREKLEANSAPEEDAVPVVKRLSVTAHTPPKYSQPLGPAYQELAYQSELGR